MESGVSGSEVSRGKVKTVARKSDYGWHHLEHREPGGTNRPRELLDNEKGHGEVDTTMREILPSQAGDPQQHWSQSNNRTLRR